LRIRPYLDCKDFEAIKNWITDERTHAFWCAGHTDFPLEKEDFSTLLKEIAEMFGDAPYVATTDEGEVVGFFCYGLNCEKNEGMLKFVMVDGSKRGQGIGKEMIKLAVKYAFEITKADTVQLNVFPENERAKKCYESIGFVERNTTLDCFKFKDESWSRCNMVIGK
jgi:RimJ/RimL family protein N-acetyltransferase